MTTESLGGDRYLTLDLRLTGFEPDVRGSTTEEFEYTIKLPLEASTASLRYGFGLIDPSRTEEVVFYPKSFTIRERL